MESANVSAQEKLDQLLHDGKITDDEYLRLSRAMEIIKPSTSDEKKNQTVRLAKNWENRELGGVCAGFARYLNIDANLIRFIFILIFFLSFLAGGAIAVILSYIFIYLILPWDQTKPASESKLNKDVKVFIFFVYCLYFLIPLCIELCIVPHLRSANDLGSQTFGFLSDRALDSLSEYKFMMNFNEGLVFITIPLSIIFALLLGFICHSIRNENLRKIFPRFVIGMGILWIVFLLYGSLSPLNLLFERLK